MKRVFSLFLCLLCVCAVTAQIRGNEIRVVVSPDHSDWVYRLNEKCTFTVRVLKAQNLLPDVKIDYELGAVVLRELSQILQKGCNPASENRASFLMGGLISIFSALFSVFCYL